MRLHKRETEGPYSKDEYAAALKNLLEFIGEHFPAAEEADRICTGEPSVCEIARVILSTAIVLSEMPHISLESFTSKKSVAESQVDAWRRTLDRPRWVFAGQKVNVERLESLTDWAILHLWGCSISIISLARRKPHDA